jgi:arginyl-tRNA synthetase
VISLNGELSLLDLISRYPEEVARAAAASNPIILTRYLFNLAEAFNKFWDTSRILTAETPALRHSRLVLTAAARQTIANGLGLLGIGAPDSM